VNVNTIETSGTPHLLRLVALLTIALVANSPTSAQSAEPLTPAGRMASSAGAYLGSLEYLRAFKNSECGFALRRDPESLDDALRAEVLPAFAPDLRSEVARQMRDLKPEIVAQAKRNVALMVTGAQKDYDRNTGCGVVAGTLASTNARALDAWQQDKQRYGWKGR
jgi:hypothetical protein